jgi:hypothetical protein
MGSREVVATDAELDERRAAEDRGRTSIEAP